MNRRTPTVPAARLRERQAAVSRALGGGVMLLPGSAVHRRSRDTDYPHRPDNELYWLTGVTEPDAVAVLLGDAHPASGAGGGEDPGRLLLFTRPRDPDAELWTGLRLGPAGWREVSGAREAYALAEAEAHLPGLLRRAESVHFRLGVHPRWERMVVETLEWSRTRGTRKGEGPGSVVDPGGILDELRLRKDPWELERIREAAALTVAGFRALAAELRPGVPEWRLQAVLEAAFRGGGGEGPAYESIVGSGENACVLHYVSNDDVAEDGELVLVDAGASVAWYAADITRTLPVSGRFTPEQRAVYQVVERARAASVAAVRPGAAVSDVHDATVRVLTEGLVALGILQGSVEELVKAEACKPFYPHQTSHWLGLDVHDVGDYGLRGVSRPLEPGMVLTVEPGLYFGPAAVEAAGEAVAPYRGMGIRIEDDVLVTAEGHENLTAALPTDPDAIEALMEGDA